MQKRLYRSRREKMLGGVCGGLGNYFEIDPVLVRVIFIVALFMTGIGFLAYIILWIVIPFEPIGPIITPEPSSSEAQTNNMNPVNGNPPVEKSGNPGLIAGLILIIIGGLFLADNLLPFFHFWHFWPIVLIVIGVVLLLKSPRTN